jgi:Transposase IS116/IS110/IS902 family
VAADHGYDRSCSYWTGPGRGWLAELDLPSAPREIITDCLAVTGGMAPVTERLDRELHQHAKADPRVKVLTALPGIGEFTAVVMLAEIGDITRFANARKLASWAGLIPAVRGSDLKVPRWAHLQTRAGVAAVGPQPGSADRQALAGVQRHLCRDCQTARDEDRHHRDRPQASHPRLPPARQRPAHNSASAGHHGLRRCGGATTRRVTKPRVSSLQRHEQARPTRPRSIT